MKIPAELRERALAFSQLGQWERAELGRQLRTLGLSYGEIMHLIPVPKGTLAGWCRDIRLTDEQAKAIKERTGSQLGVPRDTQRKRRLEVERIQAEARVFALDHMTDPFWVAGTVLYWGEGSKTRRELSLANADPEALRLFVAWVRAFLQPEAGFVMKVNLHADNDEPAARAFWAEALELPHGDFYKSFVKPDGTGHRKNHLANGVCTVRVRRGSDAFIRVLEWIDVLKTELVPPRKAIAILPRGSLAQPARAGAS